MQVTTDGSTLSASAASGRRSRLNRPTSSPTRCWASAALPPLPNASTRPPRSYAATINRAASSTPGRSSSTRATSAACSASASVVVNRHSGSQPLVGDRGRTDDADAIPERRVHHVDRAPRGHDHLRLDELAHRPEQLFARAAHAAAEDDELRLEEVRERGDAAGERLARLAPDADGDGVAGLRRRGHLRCACARHPRLLCALGDRRPGRIRLEAAPPAAPAAVTPVPVDRDVPELTTVAGRTAVEAVVDHDAAAHTGRDREVNHVARAAAGTVSM